MRGAALLVLAGLAAFAAAVRFRTAVHPGEVTGHAAAAEFETARRRLPALGSLRARSALEDAGTRLRRLPRAAGIGRVVEVSDLERSLGRGSLSAWDAERLQRFAEAIRSGEEPEPLPAVPDIRPYFRDAEGPFEFELFPRDGCDPDVVRSAVPDVVLSGEPLVHAAEESRRRPLTRATIAALLACGAVLAGTWWRRRWRRRWGGFGGGSVAWERRVLAMVLPLAVLGWTGLGIDAWTVPALVLAGTARSGAPLLAGMALLLSPVTAAVRMGTVLGIAAVVRLGEPAVSAAPDRPRRRAWLAVPALAAAAAAALLLAPLPAGASDREPVAAFVPAESRAAAAREFARETTVVGGEVYPDARADVAVQRQLRRIFDAAERRAREADGAERARWERVVTAAARDSVVIPSGLRQRRRTQDGEAVLWLERTTAPDQYSYRRMRAICERPLQRGGWIGGFGVFALAALLRYRRRALAGWSVVGPLLAFGIGAVMLAGAELGPAVPVLAVAAFCATGATVVVFAAAGAFLPSAYWVLAAAFALAAGASLAADAYARKRPAESLPAERDVSR